MRFVYHAEDDKLAHIASAYVLPHHTQYCNLHIYCILRYRHKGSDGLMTLNELHDGMVQLQVLSFGFHLVFRE